MSAEGRVLNISHVQIHCQDIARSIAFYNVLGFKVERVIGDDPNNPADPNDPSTFPLMKSENGASYTVGIGLGDDPRATTRLELTQWLEPRKESSVTIPEDRLGPVRIALSVKGLDMILPKLQAAGFPTGEMETTRVTPKLSSCYAHLKDPDGSWLTLMEWVKDKS